MNAILKDQRLELAQVLDWLEQDGKASGEQVDMVRQLAARNAYGDKHPLAIIAERKWQDQSRPGKTLSLETLTEWFAGKVDLPYFKIDPLKLELSKITSVISYAYATRFQVLPVKVTNKEITFATAQPFMREWENEIEHIQKKNLVRVVSNPEDIERYQVELFSMSKSVIGAERETESDRGKIQSLEQLMEMGRSGKLDANDQHVVSIVDWLLQYAFDQRASDIHIEPRRDHGNIRFRIDGVMHEVYQMPMNVLTPVVSRIKIVGRMDIAEKRRPQDGRLKTRTPDGQEVELRLSSMPTAFGEKLVMRIFDPDVLLKTSTELGFDDIDNEAWGSMIKQPHGIVLVTGPTGSGKTTTLYSTLKQLAKPEVNVCTVEDPIELIEPAFNQMQVQAGIELTFASGVRTLLRQDPDIIMIGEIRDEETADMAVQAALTGHLVLSTLHTNDAPSSVTRLIDLGIPPFLIHATVLGITAQRLVRTLCSHCKTSTEISSGDWQGLVSGWKIAKPKSIYKPVGCLECRNTGYMGRSGIYEIMKLSPEIKEQITQQTDVAKLRELAMKHGLRPLRLRGAQRVMEGLTTLEEVMRVAPPVGG
ncbi:MAG: GspE/PulE family protein [Gammaproteobacteria bacterium]|nr:GspE/PulE family protein [Gammaproteobacteria bacterium]